MPNQETTNSHKPEEETRMEHLKPNKLAWEEAHTRMKYQVTYSHELV